MRQTIESCERQWQFAIQTGLPETNIAGWLLAVWGETLVELDDLDRGLDRAQQGFELAEKSGATLVLGGCFVYLIRVLFSRGDFAAAKALIRKMETIDRESDLTPWTTVQMAAWQARIWLAQGNLDAASQWAQGRRLVVDGELRPPGELNDFSTLDNLVLARILIAQGRPDALAGLLALPLEASRAGGHTSTEIEVLGLQALMHQAQGAVAQGIASLEQALLLAEPAGFVHVFVDEGPPMARLLYEAMTRGIMPDYAGKLLAAFPDLETTPVAQSKISVQHAVGAELVEPLSERELEVLELFAQGLTNQEIASRLFLALNMIKAHSRNIFGKLGVHSRTRAVARARALGLLDSD